MGLTFMIRSNSLAVSWSIVCAQGDMHEKGHSRCVAALGAMLTIKASWSTMPADHFFPVDLAVRRGCPI